jgi:hypothetical protein
VRNCNCKKIKARLNRAGKEVSRISERKGKRYTEKTRDSEEIGNGGRREIEEESTERCRL